MIIFNTYGEFVPIGVCSVEALAGQAVGSLIGAGAQLFGSSKASSAQSKAADKAMQYQQLMQQQAQAIQAGNTQLAMQIQQQAQALATQIQQDYATQGINALTSSADTANAAQNQSMERAVAGYSPYTQLGTSAVGQLTEKLPWLTSPIVMDQAALEKTPGYQFTRDQGLKAAQQSATVRGLGLSGAAIKGAETFATGLADQTYQTQFNLENTNRQNAFQRLLQAVQTGQISADEANKLIAMTGSDTAGRTFSAGQGTANILTGTGSDIANRGTNVASSIGNQLVSSGNAQGQGFLQSGQTGTNILTGQGDASGGAWTAAGNAVAGGAQSVSNAYMFNKLLTGMYGNKQPTGAYGVMP